MVAHDGAVFYNPDYCGPVTINYLRYVCTVLNQEQEEQKLETKADTISKEVKINDENQFDDAQLELTHRGLFYEKNTSPLKISRDFEIESHSRSKSPPIEANQSLPIPEFNDHFKSPIAESASSAAKETIQQKHLLVNRIIETKNGDSETESQSLPKIEELESSKPLSYLERILKSRNAVNKPSINLNSESFLESNRQDLTLKRKLDNTFVIENKSEASNIDLDWIKLLISNIEETSSKLEEPSIEEATKFTHSSQINELDDSSAQAENIREPNDEIIAQSPSHPLSELGNLELIVTGQNKNVNEKKDEIEDPQANSSFPVDTLDQKLSSLSNTNLKLSNVENREDISGVNNLAGVLKSISEIESQTNIYRDAAFNEVSTDNLDNNENLDNDSTSVIRTPEFTNLLDNNLNNSTDQNLNFEEINTPQVTELVIGGIITPLSLKLRSQSPSGIIDEHYTLDNNQLAIFSGESSSEDEEDFDNEEAGISVGARIDNYSFQPRIRLAHIPKNETMGNVALSLPTFKNLVKYVDISNLDSLASSRKRRKPIRPSTDIYNLLWQKTDEFLSSLVSDLEAYAQHRSGGNDYQINCRDVILYLNKLNFKNEENQRVSQVYDISKLATNFLPLELLLSLDENLQNIKPPPLRNDDDEEEET
jgi:hypothetical protein